MNLSMRWLKDYVDIGDVSMRDFSEAMSMSGSKVEGWETEFEDEKNVVVGKILKIEPHPDSDHLLICQLDVGQEEPVQIVTGASNVHEGDLVPAALHKSQLPNGVKITKGKLRGVMSNGMMCSIAELNLTKGDFPYAAEDGIFLLQEDCQVGQDIASAIGCNDTCVEFEITPNRPDCLSVLGLAREAAVTFGKELKMHTPQVKGCGGDIHDYLSVEVRNPQLCPRYTAKVVKNVKIGPSPRWMRERLRASGVRPIDNIVDITNYVMLEYGQPMHAYDLDTIEGKEIIVRRAAAGEKFVTLDGQERQLDENVLMICDAKKAVGIAGIMGGENSMITDHVTTMLFEAACFDGTNIRKSGKRIGLRTDASAKFEKGLDPNLAMEAMNRACQLVEELGVGEVVGGAVDIYPVKREGVKIPFEPDKYNKLLGTDIPAGDMIGYFKKIDLGYDEATNEILVPSWRQDLLCDADMAEEVARFYGYDKIGTSLPSGESTAGGKSFKLRMEEKAREIAEFCGFSQAMTYSFESPKVFDKLLIPEDSKWRKTVVISNPLGEDYSIMRTLPLNGMLTSLSTNFGRRNKDVRLYEMGNIYLPKQLPLTELPEERMQLTFGMYGDGDFFTMKGVIEELLYQTGLRKKAQYDPHAELPFLHPGRKAAIVYDGAVIGYLGEVHPTVAANYAIKERVYIAVIDMPEMVSRASFDYKYEGITNFPVSSRDLSMVVPKNILVGDIEKVFEENGGKYLENYELFDVYEGEQIDKGFKSVAYSLKFRGKDKNLEESDITGAMDKILSGLKNIGIQLRG